MPQRIAVAGFAHETNTFSSTRTGLDEFVANGLLRGEEILQLSSTNTVIGGAIDRVAAHPSLELVPILSTSAIPGGLVTADAVQVIESEIATRLAESKADAVVLSLHGAMVTERSDDGDAATLRRVRGIVGPAVPIVVVLDLHANVSQELADLATILLPYNTYPHVDAAARGAEAIDLIAEILFGDLKPVSVLAKLPMIPPVPRQFSGVEPTRSIMNNVFALEEDPNVVNIGVTFGFAYADCPYAGMSVIVTTNDDRALAEKLAEQMKTHIWERREEFRPDAMTVEQAVHAAMEETAGPVILADLGDNPGGGAACDGTALLWALLDLGAPNAAVATIVDPEVVERAHQVGVGNDISVTLGAKTDDLHGFPIPVEATVLSLSDGNFVYEGPMSSGRRGGLGRSAVLACHGRHDNTVEVIVCEKRTQPYDTAVFRSQGIEPTEKKILVVKSSVHYRASFGPIASRIIEVDTPGLTSIDLTRFPYRRLPRPIWPLDPV